MDIGDVRAKFESFGWDSIEIDGHDMGAIVEALERSRTLDRPSAIVAQTKKGRGVSSMEGRFGFHGKPPSPEQAGEALDELMAAARGADRGAPRRRGGRELMAGKTEPSATRNAYGAALVELGEAHEDVVALDADLSVSTQSAKFGEQVPRPLLQRRRGRGEHDVDGLRARRHGQAPLRLDVRDLRHRPRLRPDPARHRPQRASGADLRVARRRLARRGRRLAPDDRGHRADAGDAEDDRGRPGRLQPGVPRDARLVRVGRAEVHALRPARDAGGLRGRPRDARPRRRRPARGQGHLADRDRPHGLARARGGRLARERGRDRGRGRSTSRSSSRSTRRRSWSRSPRPASP